MKDEITQRAAHILATYREKCSQQTPIGQMILPECSKLLPLHSCCITKCDALTGGFETAYSLLLVIYCPTFQEVN
jgi:hypothetical protein